jgi:RNA polymerase sigma-70 factor (ECF subfamily)
VVLVAGAAQGDGGALATLYDKYSGQMLGLCVRILRDRREAEDVLHDVFIEVWRRAGDYDRRRGSVRSWLLMRTRSRALDRARSHGFSRSVPFDDSTASRRTAADDPSAAPDHARVHRALDELPLEQRRVIELGYFEGLSSSEIATRVGAPVGTVKSRVAAGLAKLRRQMALVGGTA